MSDRIEKYRELRQRLRAMEQSDWFRETYASNRADPAIATCTSCVERDAEIERLRNVIEDIYTGWTDDLDRILRGEG